MPKSLNVGVGSPAVRNDMCGAKRIVSQDRAVWLAHVVHTHEVGGSNPPPAIEARHVVEHVQSKDVRRGLGLAHLLLQYD